MNLLLDTHVFVWAVAQPTRLDQQIQAALTSPENRLLVSAVTAWEIAIKQALGRLTFPLDRFADTIDRMGCETLPILPAHGIAAGALPRHHNDPFDRMLVAQALLEHLTLISTDPAIALYGARIFGTQAA